MSSKCSNKSPPSVADSENDDDNWDSCEESEENPHLFVDNDDIREPSSLPSDGFETESEQLLTADTDFCEPADNTTAIADNGAMSTTGGTGAAVAIACRSAAPAAVAGGGGVKVRPPVARPDSGSGRPAVPPKPQIDALRYSMANVKESVDWELDVLLGELFALQNQLCSDTASDSLLLGMPTLPVAVLQGEAVPQMNGTRAPTALVCRDQQQHSHLPPNGAATAVCGGPPSPGDDRDSAFGDASSTESAIASSSSSTQRGCRNSAFSSSDRDSCRGSLNTPSPTQQPESPSTSCTQAPSASLSNSTTTVIGGLVGHRDSHHENDPASMKAQKIKEALEKMKEANIKKLYVKFFTDDGGSKSILVDERWTVADVLRQLVERCRPTIAGEDAAIVEEYPELYLQRIYEDHELLVENILLWTRDSPNKLYFTRRPDKYAFLHLPQQFLLHEKSNFEMVPNGNFDAETKQRLITEFFGSDPIQVPELDGWLWLKADGKKSWKRHFFILRSSGLYYSPKGKSRSTKDLQCLMGLAVNQVYTCTEWKRKYKAPTEFGFAIKHPQIQVKASKYIKYVCAEDEMTYQKWIVALRIAKNQRQLYDNFLATRQQPIPNGPLKVEVPIVSEQRCQLPMATVPIESLRDSRSSGLDSPANVSRLSSSGDHRSSTTSFLFEHSSDQTGTIKRQPNDAQRCSTHVSDCTASPSHSGSVEVNADSDSDEEHFPPPPPPIAPQVEAVQNGHHLNHTQTKLSRTPNAAYIPNGHIASNAAEPRLPAVQTSVIVTGSPSVAHLSNGHLQLFDGQTTPQQPPPKPIPPIAYSQQAALLMTRPTIAVRPAVTLPSPSAIVSSPATPSTPKKAPPPPPKRAETTRLQCAAAQSPVVQNASPRIGLSNGSALNQGVSLGNPGGSPRPPAGNQAAMLQSELEIAMARRLQKMEQRS